MLEHCRGIDLDEKLKRCRVISEKDAKPIIMQIISGLKYLNTPQTVDVNGNTVDEADASAAQSNASAATQIMGTGVPSASSPAAGAPNGGVIVRRKAIIHYDLKPANILFDEAGDVKITGACKCV